MTQRRARILIVDDEPDMAESIRLTLVRAGHDAVVETDPRQAPEIASHDRPDLVVTDLTMPGLGGLQLVDELRARQIASPIIVLTGFATIDSAVEAMRRGAADYIAKPFSPAELVVRVERALAFERLEEENRYLRERTESGLVHGIVGDSAALREVLRIVDKVAPTDTRVLIVGESGTGKELIARTIHRKSPRKDAPFFAVNCGALAEGVLESELFGHERGAFTGAVATRKGYFEVASGGTLFLDEISETSSAFQSKLLRVLQEGELMRVGGSRSIPVDVRIVASTNRDPRKAIAEGRLREDLFYRLGVVEVTLPPLRSRPEDVPQLSAHFAALYAQSVRKKVRGISPLAMKALLRYAWPGNVRELENVIERAVIMAEEDALIDVDDLPAELTAAEPRIEAREGPMQAVRDAERDVILKALQESHWNRSLAARRLGIGRRTLYDKLARHGIALKPGWQTGEER
jgi:DNA-binding NtrC family response regulator